MGRNLEMLFLFYFCSSEGISQESTRVMLHAKKLPCHFWAEAMNNVCYIHNRVTLRSSTSSTLYELWKGRKPNVNYFHVFGSRCYILADRKKEGRWILKVMKGSFLVTLPIAEPTECLTSEQKS